MSEATLYFNTINLRIYICASWFYFSY